MLKMLKGGKVQKNPGPVADGARLTNGPHYLILEELIFEDVVPIAKLPIASIG